MFLWGISQGTASVEVKGVCVHPAMDWQPVHGVFLPILQRPPHNFGWEQVAVNRNGKDVKAQQVAQSDIRNVFLYVWLRLVGMAEITPDI